jgi:UDP-N-acetylglucosamine--N-acetylmuramyl-(pentapeptide) pyrophosphoryl-undecaprenol N-acetylglucosamine transferase
VEGELLDFIENMAERYAQADLVICRAGALTVAELAAVGVASILVPFPHAVDDHQTSNARFLVEAGAAAIIPQSELTPERLAEQLRTMDRASLLAQANQARELARPDAADAVADVCQSLCGK